MKKLTFLVVLIFGATLFVFAAPREVVANDLTVPPATRIEIGDPNMWDNPDVRIWGWSRDGKVALSSEEALGEGVRITFSIINLVNDRNVFNLLMFGMQDLDEPEYMFERYYVPYNEVEDIYATKKSEILRAMETHGIVSHHTPFANFPLVMGDYTYTANVRTGGTVMVSGEEETRYSVIVSRNGREKIIKRGSDWLPNHDVHGYYKSPFEDRILIAIGRPVGSHYVEFFFSGCHLTTGFD